MASSASQVGSIGVPFRTTVTTDPTTGLAAVAFPPGIFTVAPHVVASAIDTSGDGRDIVVTLVGMPPATGCTVQARKSRTLAAPRLSLGALQGFDMFAPIAAPVTLFAAA